MTAEEAGHGRPAVSQAADTGRDRPVISLSGDEVGLFASDMHLGDHDPGTARQFLSALEREAPAISHLFLLGDLFEAWVGDDQPDGVALQLIDMLSSLHAHGLWIGVMVGNRDFLLDEPVAGVSSFSARSGASVLEDPSLIELFGERVLIAHGDAWCVTDLDYQRFRAEVRTPAWQRAFLSRPLPERLAIARRMREESGKRRAITDVTPAAVVAPMQLHGVRRVIHGHTHLPGDYTLPGEFPDGLFRHVLPDWSASDSRGGFLRVDGSGWSRLPV